MPDHLLGVTVVVPTLNRGPYLLDTVRDLLAQRHRPLEILIVDQSETESPGIQELTATHPDILSYHHVSFRGLPNARNYGWQHARHEVVVYVDDDIRCGLALVETYVAAFVSTGASIVAGATDEGGAPIPSERLPSYDRWRACPRGGFSSRETAPAEHAKGCNFAARRKVLEELGGVDEGLNIGAALHEETELCLRALDAGHTIWFSGDTRLTHLTASSGGTRQPDYRRYVYALAHNRSVLIRRYSRWYQRPIGLAWSGKLIAAYTMHAHSPKVMVEGCRGLVRGLLAGGRRPRCTRYIMEST